MVFCGRPSKGCSNCRARRIKCDQFDPACSQCLRAGKECPGYRDPLALSFRDENEKVVRKARAPNKTTDRWKPPRKAGKANSSVSISSCSEKRSRVNHSTVPDVPLDSEWSLTPREPSHAQPYCQIPREPHPLGISEDSDDQGISFFFQHYVSMASTFTSGQMDQPDGGFNPVWPRLFKDKTFYDAVSSVGFAGLSNVTKNESHMVIARIKYVASLRRINTLLQDPTTDLDKTFKAVMLLVAFEVVNGESGGMWGVHMDGGVALLKYLQLQPGVHQFRLQLQFCFSCFIKCISKCDPPPKGLAEWCHQRRQSLREDDLPALPLIDIICRFVGIYIRFREGNYSNTAAEYAELLTLDAELDVWDAHLPDSWRFSTEKVLDSSLAATTFKGKCHVYSDLWTARVLNNYRWVRILINELISMHIDRMASVSMEERLLQGRSLEVISQMATDICTSVSSQFRHQKVAHARRCKAPTVNSVFILLFPLAVAGGAIGVSEELHKWTIKVLGVIGNTMGIQQALQLISVAKINRARWKVENRIYSLPLSDIEI